MALADPAVSAKDGTAPVTRDTQGPPPPPWHDWVQHQPPRGEELQGVIHGCIGVSGTGARRARSHTCAHTRTHPRTGGKQSSTSRLPNGTPVRGVGCVGARGMAGGRPFDTHFDLRAWLLAGYRIVFPFQPRVRLKSRSAQSVSAREVVQAAQERPPKTQRGGRQPGRGGGGGGRGEGRDL